MVTSKKKIALLKQKSNLPAVDEIGQKESRNSHVCNFLNDQSWSYICYHCYIFFFQSNFKRIREIRQRRRKERPNPKPGKLQRFFHAVLSVITLECCRRKTIPKMTASGTVLSVA